MKRTRKHTMKRGPKKMCRTRRRKTHWYIGIDYVYNRYRFIGGPWDSQEEVLALTARLNDCIVRQEPSGEIFAEYRWRYGEWKAMGPGGKVEKY